MIARRVVSGYRVSERLAGRDRRRDFGNSDRLRVPRLLHACGLKGISGPNIEGRPSRRWMSGKVSESAVARKLPMTAPTTYFPLLRPGPPRRFLGDRGAARSERDTSGSGFQPPAGTVATPAIRLQITGCH